MDASPSGFYNALAPLLPDKQPFTLIHIASYPKKVRKLVFTSKSDTTLDTVVTHIFVLIHESVAIYALELLSYESQDTCTLFVSKADTSGHYSGPKLSILEVTQALIKEVLVNYFSPQKKIRISLFAKKEGQYLLLGSVNNARKHILSDAALVKWWIRCIDGLHDLFDHVAKGKCTLAIPGVDDPSEIAKYFPASRHLPWTQGDIFWVTETAAMDDAALAVRRIPRFPDDPKSRFLDALVAEQRAKHVSRKQFWLELQSRQEFRLSKSVGVVGLEGDMKEVSSKRGLRTPAVSNRESTRFKELLISLDFTTLQSAIDSTERLLRGAPEASKFEFIGKKVAVPEPTLSRQPTPQKRINTLGTGLVRKKQRS